MDDSLTKLIQDYPPTTITNYPKGVCFLWDVFPSRYLELVVEDNLISFSFRFEEEELVHGVLSEDLFPILRGYLVRLYSSTATFKIKKAVGRFPVPEDGGSEIDPEITVDKVCKACESAREARISKYNDLNNI